MYAWFIASLIHILKYKLLEQYPDLEVFKSLNPLDKVVFLEVLPILYKFGNWPFCSFYGDCCSDYTEDVDIAVL